MSKPDKEPIFPLILIAVVVILFLLRGAQLVYYAGEADGRAWQKQLQEDLRRKYGPQ